MQGSSAFAAMSHITGTSKRGSISAKTAVNHPYLTALDSFSKVEDSSARTNGCELATLLWKTHIDKLYLTFLEGAVSYVADERKFYCW
jgi:hypothetical protein